MGGILSPEAKERKLVNKYLNSSQKALLSSCWTYIEKTENYEATVTEVGKIIFVNLFTKYPQVMDMFETFKEDPNWVENKHFLHHCKIFVNIIGSYIKLLNNPEEMIHHIEFLARQHIFFPVYEDHFKLAKIEFTVALNTVLGSYMTPALGEAWSQMYDLMAEVMLTAMAPFRNNSVINSAISS